MKEEKNALNTEDSTTVARIINNWMENVHNFSTQDKVIAAITLLQISSFNTAFVAKIKKDAQDEELDPKAEKDAER